MVGAAIMPVYLSTVAALAVPPCRYTVETIVGPPCGLTDNASIVVNAINQSGHAVGHYSCPGGLPRPFKWTPREGFVALPLPPGYSNGQATDIADDGVILGTTYPVTSPSTGYLWDGKTFQVFGTLPGGSFSAAAAMNNDHVATGFWGPGPLLVAFRWADGTLTSLASDLFAGESLANDISESGLITGYMGATVFPPDYRAFILNNGTVSDLGIDLPGAYATEARAINDRQEACGVWWTDTDEPIGFLWRGFFWDGERLVDLPTGGYVGAIARDLNEQSQIIGNLSVSSASGGPPALWDDLRLYRIDLMTGPLPFAIAECIAINNGGRIAAIGVDDGGDIGVILTPVLPKLGDTNCDEIVNVVDLLNVIRQWYRDGGREDLNDDGVVNVLDLFEVIVNWG